MGCKAVALRQPYNVVVTKKPPPFRFAGKGRQKTASAMKTEKARCCLARADMQNGISASQEQELTGNKHHDKSRKKRKRDYLVRAGNNERPTSVSAVHLRVRDSVWPDNTVSFRKGSGFRRSSHFHARAGWPNGMEVGCPMTTALAFFAVFRCNLR